MKLAVINKEKCRPALCAGECKKFCPVEKKETDSCITISNKAKIDENSCIGCSICVKRCPFDAIEIINLPSVSDSDIVHRYGENGFALYGLPLPKKGIITGLLGRNGIGKSTAVKILSGQEKINLGKNEATEEEIKKFFNGQEILRYFEEMKGKKIAHKPQNLSKLSAEISVRELLNQRGGLGQIHQISEQLGIAKILDNKMNLLSGGELQKVAIAATVLGDEDIYFFDEPRAFLDIGERLKVSDFIRKISKDKTTVVVEHDLLILDYLTDSINIFYGSCGAFGMVSGPKSGKYAINSYLEGFLKEENTRIRDKQISFNFTKNAQLSGNSIASWPDFSISFDSGFTLNVEAGRIHENHCIGILGKNGTGKTSFVRALVGEIEVEHSGKRKKLNLGLKISYKPQNLHKAEDELVREIIFKEKISKKNSVTFNLGVLESKKLSELSGGELQRLEIARCLSREADIYLLDEPSAYLDVEERISVAKAIKDLMVEKEKTAFVVDHDLLLISYLADSIINFEGESGVKASSGKITGFEDGITKLLKSLDVTLRKDKDSGRPRINKKDSVLDREQKERGEWVVL